MGIQASAGRAVRSDWESGKLPLVGLQNVGIRSAMRPLRIGLVYLSIVVPASVGCSTAPIADLLDHFAPGRLGPATTPPYGGVCAPRAVVPPVTVPGAVPPPALPGAMPNPAPVPPGALPPPVWPEPSTPPTTPAPPMASNGSYLPVGVTWATNPPPAVTRTRSVSVDAGNVSIVRWFELVSESGASFQALPVYRPGPRKARGSSNYCARFAAIPPRYHLCSRRCAVTKTSPTSPTGRPSLGNVLSWRPSNFPQFICCHGLHSSCLSAELPAGAGQ